MQLILGLSHTVCHDQPTLYKLLLKQQTTGDKCLTWEVHANHVEDK